MNTPPSENISRKIWTIPNVLSFFRLALIPVFVWLYVWEKNYPATVVVLVVSSLSDLADGFIARRFHMITALGKALDPIADKLTQGIMLICLVSRFSTMWLPLILLAVKESFALISRTVLFRRSGQIYGAVWHGKISTVLLDALLILHVLWYQIPLSVSRACAWVCSAFMLLSFLLYAKELAGRLREK